VLFTGLPCARRPSTTEMARSKIGLIGLAVMGQVRGAVAGARKRAALRTMLSSPPRAEPGAQRGREGLPYLRVQPLI